MCLQLEAIASAPARATPRPDERTAFTEWIAARMPGIPPDRWDDFQMAAMHMIQDYSRPTAQQRPQVQPQWSNVSQQQWGQPQSWQQNWPQRHQQQWGASTQVSQSSQQVWQQPNPAASSAFQLLDMNPPAITTMQSVRQTPEVNTLVIWSTDIFL